MTTEGVDIESGERIRNTEALLAHTTATGDHLPDTGSPEALHRVAVKRWVRKEAVLKALGTGLRLPMKAVTLRPVDDRTHRWHAAGECGVITDVDVGGHFTAAVAYPGDTVPVRVRLPIRTMRPAAALTT